MPLQVGSRLGHYNVTALIGEGGMGQVYQATDTKLKRQVALKILPEGSEDAHRRRAHERPLVPAVLDCGGLNHASTGVRG